MKTNLQYKEMYLNRKILEGFASKLQLQPKNQQRKAKSRCQVAYDYLSTERLLSRTKPAGSSDMGLEEKSATCRHCNPAGTHETMCLTLNQI